MSNTLPNGENSRDDSAEPSACSMPSTHVVDGYSPAHGITHGSLDVVVYSCSAHLDQARTGWIGDRTPFVVVQRFEQPCGSRMTFTEAGAVFDTARPAAKVGAPAEGTPEFEDGAEQLRAEAAGVEEADLREVLTAVEQALTMPAGPYASQRLADRAAVLARVIGAHLQRPAIDMELLALTIDSATDSTAAGEL
jgi:hypothetical protein